MFCYILVTSLTNEITQKEKTMWAEFTLVQSATIDDYLEIIDDAQCFGFEFKVENGKVFFREIPELC